VKRSASVDGARFSRGEKNLKTRFEKLNSRFN